jgi:hypothetical protein
VILFLCDAQGEMSFQDNVIVDEAHPYPRLPDHGGQGVKDELAGSGSKTMAL